MKIHLKKFRKQKNYSVEKLARLSGVATSTISKIENDLVSPNINTLCTLCKILKVKIEDLVECD